MDVSNRDQAEFSKPWLAAGAPPNVVGVEAASDGRLVLTVADAASETPLTLVTGWQASTEPE